MMSDDFGSDFEDVAFLYALDSEEDDVDLGIADKDPMDDDEGEIF